MLTEIMSSATAGSSRRNRYTQEWLESCASNPLTIDGQLAHDEDEEGIAIQLYSICSSVLRDLCSQTQDPHSTRPQSLLLREELTKLYLWGQSFGPGELDLALEHSDDVRYIVLDALGNIGRLLLREISPYSNSLLKPACATRQSRELKYLVDQTKAITSNRAEKDGEGDSDDTDEDSASDDEETSDIVQELRSHIRYLMELEPTLQQNLLYARKTRIESSYPPVVPFHLSDPAKIYVSLVREKYRTAQDQLVDRLGESNWQRHKMVREKIDNIKRPSEEEDGFVEENPSVRNHDVLYSAFRPYSTFHDSGIGTSVPAHTEYAPSHTSFQSSNFEDAQGSIRVPPTPEEVGAGKPFQCPFCGGTQLNIKNRVDWKLHVFADLRPYICTFATCERELAQFPTRAAWADHEFTVHRIVRSWSCPECTRQCDSEIEWIQHLEKCHQRTFLGPKHQVAKKMAYTTRAKPAENEECPLCQDVLGKPRREFVKHVGRHMEEIALMALPRDNDEESDAHSTSTEPESSPSPTPVPQGPEVLADFGRSRYLQGSGPIASGSPSTLTSGTPPVPFQEGLSPSKLMLHSSAHATSQGAGHSDHDLSSQDEYPHRPPEFWRSPQVLNYIPCSSLTIGSWRRVGEKDRGLQVFYDLDKACMTYYFTQDSHNYTIVYPFAYIKKISMQQVHFTQDNSLRHHGILIELSLPPKFFQDFLQRGDFTEDQQASIFKVHCLEGNSEVLQDEMRKLESLQIFQNRHVPLPNFLEDSLEDSQELPNSTTKSQQHDSPRLQMAPQIPTAETSPYAFSDYPQLLLLKQQNEKRRMMDTALGAIKDLPLQNRSFQDNEFEQQNQNGSSTIKEDISIQNPSLENPSLEDYAMLLGQNNKKRLLMAESRTRRGKPTELC